MAKLVTVVQTYFRDGTYRNNRVVMQIPDEAAEIIQKFWQEKQIHNCVWAKYLASNQSAIVDLKDDENKMLRGMSCITSMDQVENEIFGHSFVDDNDMDE